MLKAKELQNQSVQDLKELQNSLSKEIYALINDRKLTQKVEKPHVIREKKKDRARVLTVLRQKGEQNI